MPCGHPIINKKLTRLFFSWFRYGLKTDCRTYDYKYYIKIDINIDIDIDTVSGSSLFRVELPDRPFLFR